MENRIPKTNPSDGTVLELLSEKIKYNIDCHRIGTILSFDTTTLTAEVQMVDFIYFPDKDGLLTEKLTPTKLINVPIKINATIKGGFTHPINAGDFCLLAINDRDIRNWHNTGKEKEVDLASMRSHSVSDSIAIVGLFPLNKIIANYNNNATKMYYENTSIALDEKVEIKNDATNLLEAITDLITAINSLGEAVKTAMTIPAVVGVPLTLDGGTQANITNALSEVNNAKSKFQSLLK
jgi:hypothetical protein